MKHKCCWCQAELDAVEGDGSEVIVCPACIEAENAGFMLAIHKHQAISADQSTPPAYPMGGELPPLA